MIRTVWRTKRTTKTPTKKFDVSDVSHVRIDVSKIDDMLRAAATTPVPAQR